MKRFISGFLCVVMCLALFTLPVLAIDTSEDANLTIQVFDTEEDYQNYLASFGSEAESRGIIDTVYAYSIVRKNGASDKTCQVYVNWSGKELISAIRFKKLTVKSTSATSSKTYGTFEYGGDYVTYYATATTVGNVMVGQVNIPTSVDTVRADVVDMQSYHLNDKEWFSGFDLPVNVRIKD